jgi:hypothetical protein
MTMYLVLLSYCVKNCPLVLCLSYGLYAIIYHFIRAKVVEVRFRLKLFFPISVEVRGGQEYLPDNLVYAVITSTCFASFAIIVVMLLTEYRSKSAIPDIGVLSDVIYILQFMSKLFSLRYHPFDDHRS